MERQDLRYNSEGLDDGSNNIGGMLFPGQGQLFRNKKDVDKKSNAKIEKAEVISQKLCPECGQPIFSNDNLCETCKAKKDSHESVNPKN